MPNDENTQSVQQGQNPVVNPGILGSTVDAGGNLLGGGSAMNAGDVNSNASNSDDFDFNFDVNPVNNQDSGNPSVDVNMDDISGGIQQTSLQGRTGMFLTPDEEFVQQNDNLGSLNNVGNNVTVGVNNTDSTSIPANNTIDEDSYLAGIDPNDVPDAGSDQEISFQDAQTTEPSNEDFGEKIEEMISFDDNSQTGSGDVVNSDVVQQGDNIDQQNSGQGIETQNQTNNMDGENNVQVEQEDWLAQEDKKVEETFGEKDNLDTNDKFDVNVSSDTVANNVENIITNNNEPTFTAGGNSLDMGNVDNGQGVENTNQYVPNEADFSKMTNLLNSSNTGQVDLNNIENNQQPSVVFNGQDNASTIESVVSGQQESFTAPENVSNGVPSSVSSVDDANNNVSSQSVGVGNTQTNQDYLDQTFSSNNFGTVDNLVQNQGEIAMQENMDIQGQNIFGGENQIGNVDIQMSQDMSNQNVGGMTVNQGDINIQQDMDIQGQNIFGGENQIGIVDDQMPQDISTQNVGEMTVNQGDINMQQDMDMQGQNIFGGENQTGNVDIQMSQDMSNQNVGGMANVQGGLSLDAILDQEIQDMHVVDNQPVDNSQVGNIQTNMPPMNSDQGGNAAVVSNQVQQQNSQIVNTKKRKKQSGFVVLGLVFLVIAATVFILYKMYPDKFSNIFKNDVVVEYLSGNENSVGGTQNDGGAVENEMNNNEGVDENELNIGNGGDSNDAGILENENGVKDDEGGEDLDPNSLAGLLDEKDNNVVDNLGTSGENVDNISVQEHDVAGEQDSFDPFADVSDLLDNDDKELKNKLDDYVSKGQHYKDLGTANNNGMIAKYGEYIVVTATNELGKLENGEEIDTTLFSKFDELLSKLQNLVD